MQCTGIYENLNFTTDTKKLYKRSTAQIKQAHNAFIFMYMQ